MSPHAALAVRIYHITLIYPDNVLGVGPNNDQLFVTTAHCSANGGDQNLQEQYPDSGHIFRVDLSGKYEGGTRHKFTG